MPLTRIGKRERRTYDRLARVLVTQERFTMSIERFMLQAFINDPNRR